ncbi:MAG: LPS-assembly protein LptD [Deltaproteobacteria bacterium]|nr:LPS-assembly protein LptD [Deltaproteobacteria bacterium]TLN03686.1 MAG: LPS-assembly protein LptD [bacterium]
MKKSLRQFLLALCLLLACVVPSRATESALPDASGIQIKADSIAYDKNSDSYNASGKVRIDWSGIILFADTVSLRQQENRAVADGNVLFIKDENTLQGSQANMDLATQQGEIQDATLFVKNGNFRLTGKKLQKTGDNDYRIENGTFTTCDGEVPSWKFKAAELDVSKNDYAVGKHAVFYIKDVPVLYFPYIIYPVLEERQSGLMIPRTGLSSKKGFYLEIPYYLVISPSQEATFYLDIQTKRGAGIGANYQYLMRSGGHGEAQAYLIYDTTENKMRGNLLQSHQQSFSPTLFFSSKIELTLDREFYQDYGEATGEYNRRYLESSAFITKHWEKYSLTTELRYTEDLIAENNKATLQELPIITFSGLKQQLFNTPLYVSMDATFTNYYRQEGLQGQRITLHPMLSFYSAAIPGIESAAWVGYLQRFYNTYDGELAPGESDSGIPDVGASFSSTLSRVYDTDWGSLQRIRHTIIPEIGYSYLPLKNQENLPFFDFTDRQVAQNMVSYSITNYLTGKYPSPDSPASYRDLGYLRISQGYEFSGTRRDVLTLVDDQQPFTDIRIEARVNPTERLAFFLDSRFNPYRTDFSTTNVAADVSDSEGNSARLGYRFSRDEVRYLEGRFTVSYLDPFVFHYLTRYSFDTKDFLESYYALEFKQQCWGVNFSYRERPGDRRFLISFTLSGIGSLGNFKSF